MDSYRSNSPESGKKNRRSVACKSCHSLKVKCTPADELNPEGPCIRCLNSNRVCEIDINQPRKRRRKAEILEERKHAIDSTSHGQNESHDDTVSKLKAEVASLKLKLDTVNNGSHQVNESSHHHLNGARNRNGTNSPLFVSQHDLATELKILSEGNGPDMNTITDSLRKASDSRAKYINDNGGAFDLISRNIILEQEAQQRYDIYKTSIYEKFPYIDCPFELSAKEFSQQQPFLFNSIMLVTSNIYNGTDSKSVQAIDAECINTLSTQILIQGNKTEELLKAILSLALWYNTPELFYKRRYHLLNTLAVTLLHDLGVLISSEDEMNGNGPSSMGLQQCKIVILLYTSSVTISLILRRPVNVNWTAIVEQCCVRIETSGNERLVDLANFLRLNHQLERIHNIIHCSQSSQGGASLMYIRREFQNTLSRIKSTISKKGTALLSYYYSVEAYLHEPMLHQISNDEEGIEPTQIKYETVKSISLCTTACIKSLHQFISLGSTKIAMLPLVFTARIVYTAGMLLRLRYLTLCLPGNVERDLVPPSVITIVQNLNSVVSSAIEKYPYNYLLKKTSLMLHLFIQTYGNQVQKLLKAGNNQLYGSKDVPQTKLDKPSGDQSKLSLDILYYVANFRKELKDYVSIQEKHKLNNWGDFSSSSSVNEISPSADHSPPSRKDDKPSNDMNDYQLSSGHSNKMLPTSNESSLFGNNITATADSIKTNERQPITIPNSNNYLSTMNENISMINNDTNNIENPINSTTQGGFPDTYNQIPNQQEFLNIAAFEELNKGINNIGEEFWSDILNPSSNNFNLQGKSYNSADDIFFR